MRTKTLFVLLWSACALAAEAFAAAPPAGGAAPLDLALGETIEVNVVNVEVFVTGRDGRPVSGLTRSDFRLFEDGKAVEISNFQELRSSGASPTVSAPPGVKVTVEPLDFAASPGSASYIAVYIDDANTQPAHRARVLKQLRGFLAENVRPTDLVMVASHGRGLHIEIPFTNDREALAKALDAVEARPALGGEMDRARSFALRTMVELQRINAGNGQLCGADVKSPVESFAQLARNEALRSIQGLTFLVNSLSGVPGRKSLLWVSDGIPLTPGEELNEAFVQMCGGGAIQSGTRVGDVPLADLRGSVDQLVAAPITPLDAQKYSIAADLETLAARASASRVSVYSLQATGAAPSLASSAALGSDEGLLRVPAVSQAFEQNYEGALFALASATGGKAIFNANQIDKGMGDLWDDLSTHYSLAFSPARAADGRQHRIEVKVDRPGVRVRSLKGFRDKPLLERAVDRTLATLLYDLEDNPLEVQIEVDEAQPVEGGIFAVPVRLRIPLFKLGILNRDALFVGKLRLLVASQDAEGALAPVRQVEVPLRIEEKEVMRAMGQYYLYNLTLQLKAGRQKLAVTVRDEVTGAMSFLKRSLDVAAVPPSAAAATAR